MPQNHSFGEPTVSKFKRFDLSQKNVFLGRVAPGQWKLVQSGIYFLATRQSLVKIDKGQQKIKIVCTN